MFGRTLRCRACSGPRFEKEYISSHNIRTAQVSFIEIAPAMQPTEVHIPDILKNWPCSRHVNPHYAELKEESDTWIEGLKPFDNPKLLKAYLRCDFPLLAALCYPRMNRDGLRTACDMVNLFFTFDEFTDVADDETAQKLGDIVLDALHNPRKPRPEGESAVGEVARQFWDRLSAKASKTYLTRALPLWEKYVHATIQEAKDRNPGYIRDIDSFMELRRHTAGGAICAALNFLFTDIPDEILDHPTMRRLTELFVDVLIHENDIVSYQKEDAADEPHNMLTVYMHASKVSLQEAIDWSETEIDRCVEEFVQLQKQHFWNDPALDEVVGGYILGLGEVVKGHNSWAFERERYFGKDCAKVQECHTFVYTGIKKKCICWETAEECMEC